MEKIWFDTDIGNDIDDTVALAYLLKKPECQLLGISTVSGQSVERAMMADVICRAAGKQVPIYPGLENPLLTQQRQGTPSQLQFLNNYPHSEDFTAGRAIEAMYQAISQNPGEVTLLAVGPMTNVALLLSVHPDAASLLKEIVVMCGEFFGFSSYRRVESEWNAVCDPYATAILFNTRGVRVRSVGLDVTTQLTLDASEIKERFTSPLMKVVYGFCGFETGDRENIIFHDPLAAVDVFKPETVTYRSGVVSVEVHSERAIGRTYFDADESGPHKVAEAVNRDAFYEEYFGVTNS